MMIKFKYVCRYFAPKKKKIANQSRVIINVIALLFPISLSAFCSLIFGAFICSLSNYNSQRLIKFTKKYQQNKAGSFNM